MKLPFAMSRAIGLMRDGKKKDEKIMFIITGRALRGAAMRQTVLWTNDPEEAPFFLASVCASGQHLPHEAGD